MTRHCLPWLVSGIVAVLCLAPSPVRAQSEPVKPYILFVMDTSGSMNTATNYGAPSCTGATDTRLNHAKCAIQNIAYSYDEMVLGLGDFRMSRSGTPDPIGDCGDCTVSQSACDGSGDRFELLVPILEGNHLDLITWNDFTCGTCGANTANDPDIKAANNTPLGGALIGAKLYWEGKDSPTQGAYWTGAGESPIEEDPLNDVFLPSGAQCRPYITILLTDGDETCADFDSVTVPAAQALLSTDPGAAGGPTYRIEVKPIGFGKAPGDAEIEALAHAGGAPDVAGVNEGAYAQNEEELQLEVSRIIADAIKFEACNEVDDDCDLLADEDFPDKGLACDDGEQGICRGTGTFVCNAAETGTECLITDPGQTSTSETCNGLDDDCDGTTDEGACTGCSGVELCNNMDDDCDGNTDEALTRPCGTDLGICTAGEETCTAGTWGGCTATEGIPEECNGVDDDCDGTVDGFAEDCVTLPGNNPGVGICQPGTQVCPPDGSGMFGACIGEIGPEQEVCDGVDNDCNGQIDEGTGGDDCSSSCGVGTTVCVGGVITCDSMPAVDDDTCDGVDDDCDTIIDEDAAPGGTCDGGGQICNGTLICQGGGYVCVGESIEPELCNCENDDCDLEVDEGNLCPAGSTCVHPSQSGFACQCAQACAGGEFPCPIGRTCVDGFCLVDPCFGVTCEPDGNGDQTECVGGECVRSCDLVTCPGTLVCYGPDGTCRPDDCTTFPDRCAEGELCVAGECVSDPCAGVSCGGDEYCYMGDCVGSCAGVTCPAGQRCRLGVCEPDPCGGPCPGSEVCDEDEGECQPNPCPNTMCPTGQWCNPQNGICEPDPCNGVECPAADQTCVGGTCFGPDAFVDAGVDADTDQDHVTPGGGGGCAAGGGAGLGGVLVALGVALAVRRRRRAEVRS